MEFRFKDHRGKVVVLKDVASLLRGIESGAIAPETLLSVGSNGPWQRADSAAAYLQAVAGLGRSLGSRRIASDLDSADPGTTPTVPALPWHTRRDIRIALGATAAVLVLGLGYFRMRHLDRQRASQTARAVSAASAPSLEAQHALSTMTIAFGDSAGLTIRRGQDWLAAQRLGTRLRGPSLKNSASLRTVRAAAAQAKASVDSLVLKSEAFTEALKARADSLEVNDPRYDGLLVRLGEALDSWNRDLGEYARVERGAAATLDSVAVFLLDRQRSFVLKEGQPAFLSRVDATRFRDLNEQLQVLAGRKKSWAAGIFSRRASWMATIPDSSRPRFEGPIFKTP